MKKLAWMLSLMCCTLCIAQAKDRIIERPPFLSWNSNSIEIDKIVMSDTVTTVYIKAFYRPKNSIKIATGSVLKDNHGMLYPIRKGVGITLNKEFWMPESGEAEFQLLFPPILTNVSSLDFLNGDSDESFKIWGIQLDEKNFRKTPLPQDAIVHKIQKKAELPTPEFSYGKATLSGRVIGFQQGMPLSGKLYLYDPVRWIDYYEEVALNEDGSFQIQTNVITVTPATLSLPFAQIPCLLAPGKTSTVLIHAAEYARQASHLQKEKKPYGRRAYYGGYLAELQQELSDCSIATNLVSDPRKTISEVAGKDINGVKSYLLEKRNDIYQQIEAAPLSLAAKEVLKANTDITTTIGLFMGIYTVRQAHIASEKLNKEQIQAYYKNVTVEFPEDYFDVLNDFTLNTSADLYAPQYAYGVGVFSTQKEMMEQRLGTQGVLFQMMEAYQCYHFIGKFIPLTTEQEATLAALPTPVYKEMLTALNAELLKKMELNKQKDGYTVHEIGEVEDDALFSTILSPFKGHVLLVDVWATWCGPCRVANKAMIPMKEELKDKDILYVYVTGETSPKGTWENMIPDIHGEHFRVSNQQWTYLMNKLNIKGVPTYFVIDREGNTTFQETGFPGTDRMKEQLLKALNL